MKKKTNRKLKKVMITSLRNEYSQFSMFKFYAK